MMNVGTEGDHEASSGSDVDGSWSQTSKFRWSVEVDGCAVLSRCLQEWRDPKKFLFQMIKHLRTISM